MDKSEVFLVNLHPQQVRPPDVTESHLRQPQEDTRMLKPNLVDLIRDLAGQGLGHKRIARQLGISRNSVRRYLAGATVGFQQRPAARCLDAATQQQVQRLFKTVAEGNTVVIHQELAAQGIDVELRTLQRAVAPLRQAARAKALATVRFETPPGQQMQIYLGENIVTIDGQPVTVQLMTVVLPVDCRGRRSTDSRNDRRAADDPFRA